MSRVGGAGECWGCFCLLLGFSSLEWRLVLGGGWWDCCLGCGCRLRLGWFLLGFLWEWVGGGGWGVLVGVCLVVGVLGWGLFWSGGCSGPGWGVGLVGGGVFFGGWLFLDCGFVGWGWGVCWWVFVVVGLGGGCCGGGFAVGVFGLLGVVWWFLLWVMCVVLLWCGVALGSLA